MNNSKLAIESVHLVNEETRDIKPILREREGKLVKILDAIRGVMDTVEWTTLKEEIFDDLSTTLEKQISIEARKETPDTLKLNRLAGQLKWAEKFSDFKKLEQVFRTELNNIRQQLYGKTQE